jgi:hypothetical protein
VNLDLDAFEGCCGVKNQRTLRRTDVDHHGPTRHGGRLRLGVDVSVVFVNVPVVPVVTVFDTASPV